MAEIVPLVVVGLMVLGSLALNEYRFMILVVGFLLLLVIGATQFFATRRIAVRQEDKESEGVTQATIGRIELLSQSLYVSDRWAFTKGQLITVASGSFIVEIDTALDRTGRLLVVGVNLVVDSAGKLRTGAYDIPIDTGVLVVVDAAAASEAGFEPKTVERITLDLLDRKTTDVGVTLLRDGQHRARGFIAEAGLGDGIYTLQILPSKLSIEFVSGQQLS